MFLPSEDEALIPLEVAIPIHYTVLEEKFAGRTVFEGRIVELSTKDALVSCQEPLSVMTNLKLQLTDTDSGAVFDSVYVKVMEQSQEDDQHFYLRFTSMPKEATTFLHQCLGNA